MRGAIPQLLQYPFRGVVLSYKKHRDNFIFYLNLCWFTYNVDTSLSLTNFTVRMTPHDFHYNHYNYHHYYPCSTYARDEKRIQYFGWKTEGKRPLGRPRHRWEDNNRMGNRMEMRGMNAPGSR